MAELTGTIHALLAQRAAAVRLAVIRERVRAAPGRGSRADLLERFAATGDSV